LAEQLGALVLGLALVVPAAWTTFGYVADLEPAEYALLAVLEDELPAGARIAVQGNGFIVTGYFPEASVSEALMRGEAYDAVIVDTQFPLRSDIREVVQSGRWQKARTLGRLTVYLR
jgi:hypothetical protein